MAGKGEKSKRKAVRRDAVGSHKERGVPARSLKARESLMKRNARGDKKAQKEGVIKKRRSPLFPGSRPR